MRGAIPPLLQYAFMVLCSIKIQGQHRRESINNTPVTFRNEGSVHQTSLAESVIYNEIMKVRAVNRYPASLRRVKVRPFPVIVAVQNPNIRQEVRD
jgi:hypothetical protein